MNKLTGIVLLTVGIVLIVWGINASDSVGDEFSRFFTGTPTDKSMWLLLAGIVATVAGAVTSLRRA
jgi:drug/metabolite transporter (DMT)-like permease